MLQRRQLAVNQSSLESIFWSIKILHQQSPGHTLHFNCHFPGEPWLAGCPLNSLFHLFLNYASFWNKPKISMSSLTQSHQVFFRRPLCLIPSTSHVIYNNRPSHYHFHAKQSKPSHQTDWFHDISLLLLLETFFCLTDLFSRNHSRLIQVSRSIQKTNLWGLPVRIFLQTGCPFPSSNQQRKSTERRNVILIYSDKP